MKKLFQLILGIGTLIFFAPSTQAAFSSLYVFGDALSATADNPDPSDYYSKHYCNGRVWVEVLAQRQGLVFDNAKNNSSWDYGSTALVGDLNSFNPPSDVASALFIVWVCNADTYDAAQLPSNLAQWQAANNRSQANHLQIIAKLYAKGVRTLILPNAVDISMIPAFNAGTDYTGVEHAGCVDYNAKFANTIKQARALYPDLTIYAPDFYTLLNNVLANPANYGLKNALYGGFSIDALSDPTLHNKALNGAGASYVFWDAQDPTAKFHAVIADVTQQIISPVNISKLAVFNGNNRLDVVNMPVGLDGVLEGTTNLTASGWTTVTNFSSTATSQSIFVNAAPLPPATPASGGDGTGSIDPNNPVVGGAYIPANSPEQLYRLKFPYAWVWP